MARGKIIFGIFAMTVLSALLYAIGSIAIAKAMPFFEMLAMRMHRKSLHALGIVPDKRGRYNIQPNGLAFAPDYGVLHALTLRAGIIGRNSSNLRACDALWVAASARSGVAGRRPIFIVAWGIRRIGSRSASALKGRPHSLLKVHHRL